MLYIRTKRSLFIDDNKLKYKTAYKWNDMVVKYLV